MYIEVVGTAIVVKKNGAPIITTSDSGIASGRGGIWAVSASNLTVDDFEVGDFAGGGTTLTPAQGAMAFTGRGTSLGFAINMPDEV